MKNLKKAISECMLCDQHKFLRVLKHISPRDQEKLAELEQRVMFSINRKKKKQEACPKIEYAMDLPIHDRLDEIRDVIQHNQVVVLCGETGSGKTTQLPKLCLEMGRGFSGQIGHTQPRRIAAMAVAKRIAEEIHTSPGEIVGYKIRHTDTTSESTCVKLMTDGILLAELQYDRRLLKYDTLIIDEVHERSLNIDFILGYLKQLLPKRSDLKVIITSATIDVDRISAFFDDAPVIEVSGRSYPVEVRYHPIEFREDLESDSNDEQLAMLNAVKELRRQGPGDILIFLEGEREIYETAKFLNKQNLRDTDILPLYSRLSSARQAIIFKSHKRRHIILATNVAETSLTIPGIHYVIDRGFARISRYNRRIKVQQLPTEKISRASAEQRKGRCGRLAEGICIRLYSETDFESRPEFTDPEILRTNLASVILQMKALNLGEITDFPFINKPDIRYINDGIRLLTELRALDKPGNLTRDGRLLARLPLDPRLGRILLASDKLGCVSEILTIISALSINDPRERPLESQQKADEAHDQFNDERSDFVFFLNLWKFYQEQSRKLSQNNIRKLCRQNFLSYPRMREWQEVRKQLQQLLYEIDIHPNQIPSDYNNIHCAILYGFLGHAGFKSEEKIYTGARGIKFNIFPGSCQFSRLPKWIVAAELIETGRLYARYVARIEPTWLLKPAEHLLQKDYSDPYWDVRSQQVLANQKTSLYGLVLVANQKINFGKINPEEARKIFIHNALVEGKYQTRAKFYKHNNSLIEEIRILERKARRHDILDENSLYEFYDKHIPAGIYSGSLFEKWYETASRDNSALLFIEQKDIMQHEADSINSQHYPDELVINKNNLPLNYNFEPGSEDDGINIDVPLHMVNQLQDQQLDYLVPGLLEEKITLLLKGLPKSVRKQLVPVPDTARECSSNIQYRNGRLQKNLSDYLFRSRGINISDEDWNTAVLPSYLEFNIRIQDESGKIVAQSRNLDKLKSGLADHIQSQFKTGNHNKYERSGLTSWDFDELPDMVQLEINNSSIPAFPALVDNHNSVSIRLFDTRDKAHHSMVNGLIRLFMLELKKDFNYLEKHLSDLDRMSMYYAALGTTDQLKTDLLNLIAIRVFLSNGSDIRNKEEFSSRRDEGRKMLLSEANRICALVSAVLERSNRIKQVLNEINFTEESISQRDINDHLDSLVHAGFLAEIPIKLLENYPRYLDAIFRRIEKYRLSPMRDEKQLEKIVPYWALYQELVNREPASEDTMKLIQEFRMMLEEYRVSLFAQEMGTAMPVSPQRLQKLVNKISPGAVQCVL